MKRVYIYLLAVLGLSLNTPFVSAQVVVTTPIIGEIKTTLNSLFGALRDGDVQTIKLNLSDDEYRRHRVLFEQNTEYPAFLRKFYRDAMVRVGEIHSVRNTTDDVVAEYIVEFPGGETINTRMRLTRVSRGRWIVKKHLVDKHDQGESFGEARRKR